LEQEKRATHLRRGQYFPALLISVKNYSFDEIVTKCHRLIQTVIAQPPLLRFWISQLQTKPESLFFKNYTGGNRDFL
jgi:hypothetical protein